MNPGGGLGGWSGNVVLTSEEWKYTVLYLYKFNFGLGGGGCIVACLKYILLMTASEAALYRIIWKKKINFLVICVKMNWLFDLYAQFNFLEKRRYVN